MPRIPVLSREEMGPEQQKVTTRPWEPQGGSAEDHRWAMRIRRVSGGFTTHPVRISLTVP